MERPAGWNTEEDQVQKSTYVESKWRDPADPSTSILVDSQPDTGQSAQANAASVESQTSTTPGYQQVSFESATVAGSDAWKWVFQLPGSERVDYFLNACGTSFAILGSTSTGQFDQLAPAFERVANSLRPDCGGASTNTQTSSASAPSTTTSADFCTTHTCIPNFDNGNGYIVQCQDGEWSHSGGIQGACSDHGGETSNTYP